VLDFKNVLYIDSSGADTVLDLVHTCHKRGVRLIACGLAFQPQDILLRCGVTEALGPANLSPALAQALELAVHDAQAA
jgi:SulP family sulfate permease